MAKHVALAAGDDFERVTLEELERSLDARINPRPDLPKIDPADWASVLSWADPAPDWDEIIGGQAA